MDDAGASLQAIMAGMGRTAREGARALRLATPEQRTAAIQAMAVAIREDADAILTANAKDLARAEANGVSGPMLDRLALDAARLEGVAAGVEAVAAIPDPVGVATSRWTRPNGLDIARVRTPIGVIAMIYESRPNVTADAAAIALRSGNAVILRGGSEAANSNRAIHAALVTGISEAGLPADAVQFVPVQDRAVVGALLRAQGQIDMVIPRGGRSLVERVQNEARVPVLAHLDGICHTYVHAAADTAMAEAIVVNAKMRRTGICGALETVLIDQDYPEPARLIGKLIDAGCEVRADDMLMELDPRTVSADEVDWGTEYLDTIISAKMVSGVDEAVAHIARYGSQHTEAIITEDSAAAEKFLSDCDSAIVMHNASTQYADGGEFGLGAEIGIATGRLHARGPVALEGLTTYKWIVRGSGQIRP